MPDLNLTNLPPSSAEIEDCIDAVVCGKLDSPKSSSLDSGTEATGKRLGSGTSALGTGESAVVQDVPVVIVFCDDEQGPPVLSS